MKNIYGKCLRAHGENAKGVFLRNQNFLFVCSLGLRLVATACLSVLTVSNTAYGAPESLATPSRSNTSGKNVAKNNTPADFLGVDEIRVARVVTNEHTIYSLPPNEAAVNRDGCIFESKERSAMREMNQILRIGITSKKIQTMWMPTYAVYLELRNGSTIKLVLSRQGSDSGKGQLNGEDIELRAGTIAALKKWTRHVKAPSGNCVRGVDF